MFDRELTQHAFSLGYARRLVADVPDDRMAEQPAPMFNHPAWVLGHLSAATDYGLQVFGLPGGCPPDWHVLFAPGQVPSPERSAYPPKDELVAGFEAAQRRLADAVRAHADPVRLTAANPVEALRPSFPTLADLLTYLLTTHLAGHLGQLSAWRRAVGLPPA